MYKYFFKRVVDIIIGLIALPFVLLTVICCAPFIYLCDRGPIFYNATRAGKDYKPFRMFKLERDEICDISVIEIISFGKMRGLYKTTTNLSTIKSQILKGRQLIQSMVKKKFKHIDEHGIY